jgi:hypothetical protein
MWKVSTTNLPRALVTPTPPEVPQPLLIREVVLSQSIDPFVYFPPLQCRSTITLAGLETSGLPFGVHNNGERDREQIIDEAKKDILEDLRPSTMTGVFLESAWS